MPLKLIPPREGRTPFYSVRGTHLGVYVDRSTKLADRAKAAKLLVRWREEIERGEFAPPARATFLSAAIAYVKAGGEKRFVGHPIGDTDQWTGLIGYFGDTPLDQIDQEATDDAALALYPNATASTRNRQVHTVVSAIRKHAGIKEPLKRPKGWRGTKRVVWFKPEEAFRLFAAADKRDPEFGLFLRLLCYTGLRLSEALELQIAHLDLSDSFAYIPETKNEDPRGVFLPPHLVVALANHPRGLDRSGKVFKFRKQGHLYELLADSAAAAGVTIEDGVAFHKLRHTWATWMRKYAGLDTRGLVGTGTWRDPKSAERYEHVVATEEARRAVLLPTENASIRGESVDSPRSTPKKRGAA